MAVHQGTRYPLVFCVEQDLTGMTVYLYIKTAMGDYIIKSGNDLETVAGPDGTTTISILLSQADTLRLPEGVCQVHARWIDQYGNAEVTDTAFVSVIGIEPKDEIEYREDETV